MTCMCILPTDSYRDGYLLLGHTKAKVKSGHTEAAMVPDILFYDNHEVYMYMATHKWGR